MLYAAEAISRSGKFMLSGRGFVTLKDFLTRAIRGFRGFGSGSGNEFIEEEAFHKEYWRRVVVPLPPEISVELSSLCDLRCATCSLSYRDEKGKNMDLQVFELLLEQTREFCGSYNLHGIGESLLHPHLITCVEKVKSCQALCRITTNGLKLTPERSREMIGAGLDSVTFSVDAATPNTYKLIRGSNSFERLHDNIRTLADLRTELGCARPKITTAFVANTKNADDLPAFVTWSKNVGADSVFIQCYEDRGWGGEYRLSKERDFVNLLKQAESTAEGAKILLQYEYPARMEIETGRVEATELPVWDPDLTNMTYPPRYTACEAPWVHGIVRANGDIDTCWFGETLGNIRNETFAEIWNGPAIRKFRQRQRSPGGPPPCCAKARGWHYCNPLRAATDSIAMGPDDHRQLGLGWHVRQDEPQRSFRFTDSTATVFLRNSGKPYLAMHLCAYTGEVRVVNISVNDVHVADMSVGSSWREYVVPLPFVREQFIQLTLNTGDFTIPCRTADSFDYRRLGVAVSLISLRSTRWPGWKV